MKQFRQWFLRTFRSDPPGDLMAYLKDHPEGSSGRSGILLSIDDIMTSTEEMGLASKGVLYLGDGVAQDALILRVGDGKVFLVSASDLQSVDATFKNLSKCLDVLKFE